MNLIKITMLAFIMAISVGATSSIAYAEEATSSVAGVSEVISHIEKALDQISKSDFSAARGHIKSARTASETISGHEDEVKAANALVIQGQIKAGKGNVADSTADLNKALEIYKAL